MTRYERDKLVNKLAIETTQKLYVLAGAYLMEEPEFNYSEDRIIEFWQGLSRWAGAVDEHLISLEDVARIFNEKTGAEVHFK